MSSQNTRDNNGATDGSISGEGKSRKVWKPRDPSRPGAGQKLGGEFKGVRRER